ncbi:polysaccharide biosynthesis/export family protein [Sphingomonas sp. SRS2]|uniref:polysaccharide biosynthesis/export family protein n=1 Tax=Sphingomonas sp. SRS2 TaxID=133190 RepID=UPI0006183FA2|nr:polysaccharide biosynthesis/export family protein [Sphingomonas sp. SRS2]KKC24477.1 polysaccharide export protein [Sphingomonas sp. SRS2]
MQSSNSARFKVTGALSMLAFILSGCAALPSSGPTGRQVIRGAEDPDAALKFAVVDLDGAAFQKLLAAPPTGRAIGQLAALAREGRVDRIAPGDALQVNIYEVGMTLFGNSTQSTTSGLGSNAALTSPDTVDPTVRSQPVNIVTVASDGTIRLPYVGRLMVAGSTAYDVQRMIEQALHGKSQSPQAMVTVVNSPGNSIYLIGDVNRSGRVPLTAARERLLDAVATAGGSKTSSADTLIRLTRGGQSAEMRLGDIRAGSSDDLTLLPGDRVELVYQPRSFSAFGATPRVSQVNFDAPGVSLAEALARVGGPNDVQADPRSVFLFRYDAAAIAAGEPPVIYRLNLMKPESYIIAQNFPMRDKDLIYIANSAANPVSKFVGILNQLFAPLLTARVLTKNN